MVGLILMLVATQVAGDTIRVDVASALERGLEVSPLLSTSRYRAEAASRRAVQASAWPNPRLGVSAENVGQEVEFTGRDGLAGLEGQAVLTTSLPLGRERSGSIRLAQADARSAAVGVESAERLVRQDLLGALGGFLRAQALAESAREELETLSRIAENLALQAEQGRASVGDAARADLARGVAATRLARREATFAVGAADLARLLRYPSTQVLRVEASMCLGPQTNTPYTPEAPSPEVRAAEARVEAARGSVEIARGLRMPDLEPQIGLRRSGDQTGLYVGLSTTLPLFDRGAGRLHAALAEESAAAEEKRGAEERWRADLAGAERALAAFERAGERFGASWFRSLEQTVTAADARFRLGESTLFELLDARRARLQALDDYVDWQSEWWQARIVVASLQGRAIDARLLCLDPYRGAQ